MPLATHALDLTAVAQPLWWMVAAVAIALVVDRLLGEPPARLHPVVWMGNYLGWAGVRVQRRAAQQTEAQDWSAFWCGVAWWCVGACVVAAVAWALQSALTYFWLAFIDALGVVSTGAITLSMLMVAAATGVLLKPLLAWAMLQSEVMAVESALSGQGGGLEAGRARLRWLVSRDVSCLSASGVRESAIESLAENLNDSVIAPLFWFFLLGLPGAAVYRFANTADAMWGYQGIYNGHNWEWAGKWAARVDDVLSWVPARITAVLLMLACGAPKWKQLPHEAARTPSPNSGWPMAAMSLALNVHLSKPGVYVLNSAGDAPAKVSTAQAVAYGGKAVLLFVGLVTSIALVMAWTGLSL